MTDIHPFYELSVNKSFYPYYLPNYFYGYEDANKKQKTKIVELKPKSNTFIPFLFVIALILFFVYVKK